MVTPKMSTKTGYITLIYTLIVISTGNDEVEKSAKQQIQSYQPCSIDSDCKPNSFCYGNDDNKRGKCKCLDGFELNRNNTFYECVKSVQLGEACEGDFQCKIAAGVLALCNGYKICECNPEIAHNYTDGLCYKTINLTEPCLSDQNCLLSNGDFGFCTSGHCECNLHYKPDQSRTGCIPAKDLGEKCAQNSECSNSMANTHCSSLGVCECRRDYVLSRDGISCLQAAIQVGDPCIEDLQCISSLGNVTICTKYNETNAFCTCQDGYHVYDTKCIASVSAGDACKINANCIFDKRLQNHTACIEGFCKCTLGPSSDDLGCNLDSSSALSRSSLMFTLCLLGIYFHVT